MNTASFENHINLKKEWAKLKGVQRWGLARAMESADIPVEGTHHRAAHDARNIAKLAKSILLHLEADYRG
jgi:inhibitor of KinA sporulation pathway (predicted exonuclease)